MAHTLKLITEAHSKALEKGARHEMEHTSDKQVAAKIAQDHLDERPDYYEKLDKCMKEENLTELSQQVLQNYKMKANKQIARKQGETGAFGTRRTNAADKFHGKRAVTDYQVIGRRKDGIAKANKRLVSEDNITEISNKKVGRYLDKARNELQHDSFRKGLYALPQDGPTKDTEKEYVASKKKSDKRWRGIGMASRKLMKESVDVQEARGAKKNGIHKQIRKAVKSHDLTHMMSDSGEVYRRGKDQVDKIEDMAKRIPKANFRQIWNKNADKKLRKPTNKDFHIQEADESSMDKRQKRLDKNAAIRAANKIKSEENAKKPKVYLQTYRMDGKKPIKEAAAFIGTKNPDTSGKPKPIFSIYQKLVKASKENTAADATKDFAKRNEATLKNTTSHYNPNAEIKTS